MRKDAQELVDAIEILIDLKILQADSSTPNALESEIDKFKETMVTILCKEE